MIDEFSSDLLEKYCGKLRMGSGGTYFITAQQVIEKTTIWKTKLLLKLRVQLPEMVVESGHVCTLCKYKLTEEQCELDNLPQEENIPCLYCCVCYQEGHFSTTRSTAPTPNIWIEEA